MRVPFFNGNKKEYPTANPIKVDEAARNRDGILDIAERLTQHQVLWRINANDGPNVTITFVPTGNEPITFDYFEFYRSAE